jgi:hypothetical protein
MTPLPPVTANIGHRHSWNNGSERGYDVGELFLPDDALDQFHDALIIVNLNR